MENCLKNGVTKSTSVVDWRLGQWSETNAKAFNQEPIRLEAECSNTTMILPLGDGSIYEGIKSMNGIARRPKLHCYNKGVVKI